ncbi:MAG: hypothetical protein U1D96_03885 [Eubacteriales bacterium]|nr:hypothetical protein [Pseudomonadota bacterium]MBU4532599.1 hypothetical protein [Bacillota bacterium]MBV1728544.1 hypothetical protein [Desulforudis sp.]MDQ7790348.1 hypothetical protein [Clostridia bacterium]MDZ4042616.1 hypothetical protein [Eubacteriales bacterium]
MSPLSVVSAIVQGIPECLAMVFLVYALLGLKVYPVRTVCLGLLLLSIIFVIRNSGAPFPAHTLFSLMMMSVVISTWERISLNRVFLAYACSVAVLVLVEQTLTRAVLSLMATRIGELSTQSLWYALAGLPHVVVIALIAWWLYRRGGIRLFKDMRPTEPPATVVESPVNNRSCRPEPIQWTKAVPSGGTRPPVVSIQKSQ